MIAEIKLSQQEELLCQVISGRDEQLRRAAWQELCVLSGEAAVYDFAEANELEAVVAHAAGELVGEQNLATGWMPAHEATRHRVQAYLDELENLAKSFAERGVDIVALKNGGIAHGIHPCPGCCPMGDVDILVAPGSFRATHLLLLEKGYQFASRSPIEVESLANAEAVGGGEYWKVLPEGEKFWLEVQWRPVAGRWLQPDQEPPAEQLISRSIPVAGSAVRLLEPEDNLLQVALHTAKHSYVRAPGFRLHLDVERIVRAYPELDWQVFLERVERLQVKTAVYFAMTLPARLFGTPVPAWVLDRLQPVAWRERLVARWLERAGLFNPRQKKFHRIKYILFNLLLYDHPVFVLRSLFPSEEWMRRRYRVRRRIYLPFIYLQHWFKLAFRRVNT